MESFYYRESLESKGRPIKEDREMKTTKIFNTFLAMTVNVKIG